ncbi:MAG: ABC transporter ATP-binding protein [Candidatus Thermoplasmatota archaeon]|nr:ABC transporter ATP-binding protein [Candidatus Thermoplasmatota archaeon]MCL5789417.1 ABC transporter ATP-binding protein [Candidatus Thermoplasmatota archaeon]
MIEIQGITKRYNKHIFALKGIEASLKERVTTVIGRNGAGKTTLIRILSTQLFPSSGTALIEGFDILKETKKVRQLISSIPQEAQLIGILSPLEQMQLYLMARGFSTSQAKEESKDALDELELYDFRNAPSDTLSGGMKRKVFVAMALAAKAPVIFLDEPTTGLDPLSRIEVWSAIKRLSSKIILTTHYMEEAQELSNEVVVIDQGKIITQGTVNNLLSTFNGKMRAEKLDGEEFDIKIANVAIKYIEQDRVDEFLRKGYDIKRINLDDIFLSKGVSLES